MDRQAGQRAHRQSWPLVIAGYSSALTRVNELVRPGGMLAFIACLAVLLQLRRLTGFLPSTLAVGFLTINLALPPLHFQMLLLAVAFGLSLIILAWWLPGGHAAALWCLLPLAAFAVPLALRDPLWSACAMALLAAALIPVLAQGEDDGGATLVVGLTGVAAVSLVIGLAVARSASDPELSVRLPLARAAILVGLALLFGTAPSVFWMPGAAQRGHATGAALAAALLPAATFVLARDMMDDPAIGYAWLSAGLEKQAIVPAALLTVLLASALAVVQSDIRRIAGLLLVADLGYTIAGWAPHLISRDAAAGFDNVLGQLLGRSLAALVLFPCLAFLTSGLRSSFRPALLALLACGGWMAMGGPLTAGFAARRAALEPLLQGDQTWAALLCAGMLLGCLACVVMLARAWMLPLKDSGRPAPWLALVIVTAVVVMSASLGRHAAWLDAQIAALLAVAR